MTMIDSTLNLHYYGIEQNNKLVFVRSIRIKFSAVNMLKPRELPALTASVHKKSTSTAAGNKPSDNETRTIHIYINLSYTTT
jgi:hypothetical protein